MPLLPRRLVSGAAAFAATAMLLALPACAQQTLPNPVATTQVAAAEVELGGPAMWKVADEDTTIYLFGTVHALPENVAWDSGAVHDALMSADVLVTEIDMNPETMAAIGAIVAEKGMLPAGQTLRSLMTDEQRATYEAVLTANGLPVSAFDPMEPWMATLGLANIAMSKGGIDPARGVEKVLEEKVKAGTQRAALETIEYQLAIFDGLPMESQIEYLIETAEGFDDIRPTLARMIDEWAAGDAEELGALMNEAFEKDEVLLKRLLTDRNANWAVWIDNRLDQPGVVFMAVGAGHLAGNGSVQQLLEARGITSTRVQ